ncbi:DUF3180 domain-containing protein [Herbiconiux moechotypicola]|uniref:DUF3180 domain-containing protein n=1 Tax=Herbiconiux moechotypicola TaxID=637393 RepID=A0ABP5QZB7_9MICO|nr:DUF3180 domain-containing protein [Herbiconiux moechotypicola]MCS5731614.1 DUF3180 domain-containing protein [Herbiconiux moechotypicola]
MRHTRPVTVVLFALLGVVIGFVLEVSLASAGLAVVNPPLTIAITLVAAGAIVLALAIPIRRAIRGTSTRRIDPFRAMRVVVLAKASSLVGALMAGFGVGVLAFLLTRPVIADAGSLWPGIATAVAGAVLLVAGLVAERLCTLPPDEPEAK